MSALLPLLIALTLAVPASASAIGHAYDAGGHAYDGVTTAMKSVGAVEALAQPSTVGHHDAAAPIADASRGYLRRALDSVAPGSLRTVGSGFSASEQRVAQLLADGGDTVLLREATGVGRTSDLLVNGVPYDVYTPTTGNIDRIVSAVSSKGSQVQGGGVIIDLADSPLTTAQLGDILPRVQGVTSQISDIRVVGG
jgi:Contact-dependent growth inhibition CdiA C-terminal domain